MHQLACIAWHRKPAHACPLACHVSPACVLLPLVLMHAQGAEAAECAAHIHMARMQLRRRARHAFMQWHWRAKSIALLRRSALAARRLELLSQALAAWQEAVSAAQA